MGESDYIVLAALGRNDGMLANKRSHQAPRRNMSSNPERMVGQDTAITGRVVLLRAGLPYRLRA